VKRLDQTIYLAPEGFVDELRTELGDASDVRERLVFAPGPPRTVAWAQNVWLEPYEIEIGSITDAARKLRSIQRNWALCSLTLHRRAKLIQDALPHVSARPISFPSQAPAAPLGSWTLLDTHRLIASPNCTSPFPNGEVEFKEDRQGPPSRAYLKLWEALVRLGKWPRQGERCIELGSSPGGWTYALHKLGADVISVDKAPLDPKVAALPRVSILERSAFSIEPEEVGAVDWWFCDVICYPARLFTLVSRWLAAGTCRRFVATLKFQGRTDHQTARRFAAIPGSLLVHLFHNKHELTWILAEVET